MTQICKLHPTEIPRVREEFAYDPETGVVTRLKAYLHRKAGRKVLSTNGKGYLRARFGRKNIRCTHIAWILMLGRLPIGEIDHINGVRHDDRWVNLREVTSSVNSQNRRRAQKNSKSGFLGVSPSRGRWEARIAINGKDRHLGRFDTPEDAYIAYVTAKRKFHDGCTI